MYAVNITALLISGKQRHDAFCRGDLAKKYCIGLPLSRACSDFSFLAPCSSTHLTAASNILQMCFVPSSELQLKSAVSATVPDLGSKTTGCRELPCDSEPWGLERDLASPSDSMAFQNSILQKGTQEASNHLSLSLQCCMVVFLTIWLRSARMLHYSSSLFPLSN